jgi:ABC-type dipeptide/oligopeptide/nickel transport system permease subunit
MAVSVATPEEFSAGGTIVREQTSLWLDGWRRLKRNRLALAAAIYLTLLIAVALVALKWTPHDPNALSLVDNYAGPQSGFWFGGDHLGRDLVSRLMIGAQVSLVVGLGTQVVVVAVGVVLGLAAGYFRGMVDNVLSLIINVFYGIPDLLVAMILVILPLPGLSAGPSISKIIIAIAATRWMDMARLVRGQALSLREREFIEAAKASGARPGKIIFGHLLPNSLGPIIVQATLGIPAAILFEAFLSYLGLGIKPPTPSWGSMSAEGVEALRLAPHIVMPPAIALVVTLLAFNFLGDGLRDAFDPRQKR